MLLIKRDLLLSEEVCITYIHFIGDLDAACVATTQPSKQVYMAHDKPHAAVHTVSLKLPPFWQEDPALWFHQMEAQFATKGITQQVTKYHYIVGSLAPEIAREVRDVIVTVPAVAPFDTLKERLVSRTSLTESQRMQKLLSLEPLGDQKPSQLLQRIEKLADKNGNDDPILHEIFLTRLPVAVQLVLKSYPDKSTEQLASLADSLVAVTQEASHLGPSAPSHLSLLILTLLPLSALSWKTLNVNSPCNRKLVNFHLPLPPPLPSHSVGTMPDLARMPPNAKNLALCRGTLSPPTDGDQWIGN